MSATTLRIKHEAFPCRFLQVRYIGHAGRQIGRSHDSPQDWQSVAVWGDAAAKCREYGCGFHAVGKVLRIPEAVAEGRGSEGLAEVVEDFGQLKRLVFGWRRLEHGDWNLRFPTPEHSVTITGSRRGRNH